MSVYIKCGWIEIIIMRFFPTQPNKNTKTDTKEAVYKTSWEQEDLNIKSDAVVLILIVEIRVESIFSYGALLIPRT